MPAHLLKEALSRLDQIVLGKPEVTRLALACLLARGHLLLEDVPGLGKTTLAHALAGVCELEFRRIQFTSDLLPSDVLGTTVYHPREERFSFHPGALFTHLVLADELNRASPRTQSALLEAMEEGQVSVEGERHILPQPFFVIATQNPHSHAGTYPLPESQLDRFLMRLSLGYPDIEAERSLLRGQHSGREALSSLEPVLNISQLQALQQQVRHINVSDALVDYLLRLVRASREHEQISLGLSPRAALGLKHATQAMALIHGRDYALPEDVQAVFSAVAGHRLVGKRHPHAETLARQLLADVAVVV